MIVYSIGISYLCSPCAPFVIVYAQKSPRFPYEMTPIVYFREGALNIIVKSLVTKQQSSQCELASKPANASTRGFSFLHSQGTIKFCLLT